MARNYNKTSIVNLDAKGRPLPLDTKNVMMGTTPTNPGMAIAEDWDSIEGMDKAIHNSLKGISKKRS